MTRGLELNIDIGALAKNYRTIENRLQGQSQMSVAVKADAYGLGIEKLAPLFYELGCRNFFVARTGEAMELNNILPKKRQIYVLDGVKSFDENILFKNNNITPVVNTLHQMRYVRDIPVVLHFDTGMNRLGLSFNSIQKIKRLEADIKFIMTHAASADEPNNIQTDQQFKNFARIRQHFKNIPASFANSAASFSNSEWHLDLVRPGIALYGGESLPHDQTHIENVVSLYAPVLQTRSLLKGETVGYGATYKAERPIETATLGIGYADGLFRQLSNTGSVYYRGQKCPIIGRVSMDLTIIDISNCSPKPKTDDMVEILGPYQSVDDLARDADTIGYDVLTRLGKSIKKCYSNESIS